MAEKILNKSDVAQLNCEQLAEFLAAKDFSSDVLTKFKGIKYFNFLASIVSEK